MIDRIRLVAFLFPALFVAACASEPPRPVPQPPLEPPRNVLAEIRDRAMQYRGDFQVELVREAEIAEAIERSRQAEMRGDRRGAEQALIDALDDPEARQRYAELLLARGAAAEAERLARESWNAGPKVGEWCARNWYTIAEAREAQNAPNGARQARERAAACTRPRVNRY